MNLTTYRLLRDDPHVLAFLARRYDGITARSRWVVTDFARAMSWYSHMVYDELERVAEEYGVDTRRLIWSLLRGGRDFQTPTVPYRVSARGAFALLRTSRNLSPGAIQEAVHEVYDEVARQPVFDRNQSPYEGDGEAVQEALWAFARWAHTYFKQTVRHQWTTRATQASKDVASLYDTLYGESLSAEEAQKYVLWDVQESLVRPLSPLKTIPWGTRIHLAEILRWLIGMKGPGRTNPVIG